jgi:hypothetical protein
MIPQRFFATEFDESVQSPARQCRGKMGRCEEDSMGTGGKVRVCCKSAAVRVPPTVGGAAKTTTQGARQIEYSVCDNLYCENVSSYVRASQLTDDGLHDALLAVLLDVKGRAISVRLSVFGRLSKLQSGFWLKLPSAPSTYSGHHRHTTDYLLLT